MHLLEADGMHMPPKVVGAETHPAHIEFEFAQHSIPNQTLVPLYARPQMSCRHVIQVSKGLRDECRVAHFQKKVELGKQATVT